MSALTHTRAGTILIALAVLPAALDPTVLAQDRAIVLRAARMFDGHEKGAPVIVVVEGSVSTPVGNTAQTPAGAHVTDLGDATLSSGFIDAHTHLSSMYETDYRYGIVDSVTKGIPEQTLLAVDNLKKTLMAGVTTVRDLGSRNFID